jgi:hypothetical protein
LELFVFLNKPNKIFGFGTLSLLDTGGLVDGQWKSIKSKEKMIKKEKEKEKRNLTVGSNIKL